MVGTLVGGGCVGTPRADRPGAVEAEGLPNLARVDDGLWRSAQPTAAGLAYAARTLGVRTVLNLRAECRDGDLVAGTGLALVEVPMVAWKADDAALASALAVLSDPSRRPVLVHCQHGRDRTGLVVAAYRRVVSGWSLEAADAERVATGADPFWWPLRRALWRMDPAATGAGTTNPGTAR